MSWSTVWGEHIAEAANKPEYQWEFAVIQDDKMVNAFALPGGKVAIFHRDSPTYERRCRIGNGDGA